MNEVLTGDGYAVGSLDALGEGPGFRKVRRELDVKEFGVNAKRKFHVASLVVAGAP